MRQVVELANMKAVALPQQRHFLFRFPSQARRDLQVWPGYWILAED
jgi:hypothetical protein